MTKTEFEIIRGLENKKRHLRLLMKKISKAVVALACTLLVLSFLLGTVKSLPFFYDISESIVTVEAGDTLWEIAKENMGDYPYGIRSYIAEIRRLNNIESTSSVNAGQILRLPVYSNILP